MADPKTIYNWRRLAITTSCLEGGFRVGLRLGVRQGLDCRPQLIDQRIAVANLLSLLDAGQSVPQSIVPPFPSSSSPTTTMLKMLQAM